MNLRGVQRTEFFSHSRCPTRRVQQAIQHALDNWLIDKVIDYPLNSEGKEVGRLTWFLCPLSEEESDFLKNLPDIEKTVLKILRERETEYGLGTMSEEDLLLRLEELGFEADYVPIIEDRVSDFYEPENDELIAWYYLVPRFERTPEFKKTMKELDKLSLRKELRYERESRARCMCAISLFLLLIGRGFMNDTIELRIQPGPPYILGLTTFKRRVVPKTVKAEGALADGTQCTRCNTLGISDLSTTGIDTVQVNDT